MSFAVVSTLRDSGFLISGRENAGRWSANQKTQRSFVFVCKQKQSYLLILFVVCHSICTHGDQWLKRTLVDNGCDKALWVYISLYFSNTGHPMVAKLKCMVLPASARASFTSCLLAWIASIQMLIDTFSFACGIQLTM